MALTQTKAACSPHLYNGPADYNKLCADLDADCKAANDALAAKHAALLAELKAECERQKGILAGKEDTHAEEKSDVKVETMDVSEARETVSEFAHCRPELAEAKQQLAREEATPNDSSDDINRECKAKKLVMEKESCVAKLIAAEAVLAKEDAQHKEESHEEGQAASALPPQEEKVRIACQAVDDLGGVPTANCRQGDKEDALLRQADQYIEDLLAEYLRQKAILEGQQSDHSDEKADVSPERKDVAAAKKEVAEDAHCPPELEKALAELSKQESIPDETTSDIDAECQAKQAVLEAQACVDRLRKAERVLVIEDQQHAEESREEDQAAAKLPPQEKIVCELKAALDAARAARKSLPCGSEDSSPAPAPAPEPEKKSGATRATVTLAAVAALLCALVQA